MNTSENKIQNILSKDPLDRLIYEKGLRIRTILILKNLDLFLMILSNGKVIKTKISLYNRLKKASQKDLNTWKLRGDGIGISWKKLDEDLSLKGFIKEAMMKATIQNLENPISFETVVV